MRLVIDIGIVVSTLLTIGTAASGDPGGPASGLRESRPVAVSFMDQRGRPAQPAAEGFEPRSLVTADFDEDGIADVAVLLSDPGRGCDP